MTPVAARSILAPVIVCAIGIALFVGMDTIMKYLAIRIGAYNALLWRILVSLAIMVPLHWIGGGQRPRGEILRLHVWRNIAATIAVLSYFWALKRVTLAEGIALSFIAPLAALLLAGLLLKERIRRRSVLASFVAMAGVVIILTVQPEGFVTGNDRLAQCVVLIGALFYALNIVLGRPLSQRAGPFEVALWFNIVAGALLLPALPLLGAPLPVDLIGPVLLAAVISNVCVMLMAWAYARAETQYLLPLEYTAFLWAMLFGWLVFGEQVTAATFGGAALIVGGCLWALGEQKGGRQRVVFRLRRTRP